MRLRKLHAAGDDASMIHEGGIEIMVLDVPRELLPDLEEGIGRLARTAPLDMANAVAMPAGPGTATPPPMALHLDASSPAAEETIRALVEDREAGELIPGSGDEADAAYSRGALFGAGNRVTSLRDELAEVASQLPDSHAAVLVVLRHSWRETLDSLLASHETHVIAHTWLDEVPAEGGRRMPLEDVAGKESADE